MRVQWGGFVNSLFGHAHPPSHSSPALKRPERVNPGQKYQEEGQACPHRDCLLGFDAGVRVAVDKHSRTLTQRERERRATMAEFEVFVSKADFKFNCAHFIAFQGFRERLHGHNYTATVKATGGPTVGPDGYVMDFGDIKKAMRLLCKELNEYFICPDKSDCLAITETETQLCLECEDGASFSFPKGDVIRLPIAHSSAEELAHYLWCRLVRTIGLECMLSRGIKNLEVSIAEAPAQAAVFRCPLPSNEEQMAKLEINPVKSFVKGCRE